MVAASELLRSQNRGGIHTHRAARWNPRRQDGDCAKQRDRHRLRQRIPRLDSEEQASHRARGRQRSGQAEAQSNFDHPRNVAHDEAEHIAGRSDPCSL